MVFSLTLQNASNKMQHHFCCPFMVSYSSFPGSFKLPIQAAQIRATTPSVKLHHESRQITVPQPERGSCLNRKMVGKWFPYSHHHLELVVEPTRLKNMRTVKLDHETPVSGVYNKKGHTSGKIQPIVEETSLGATHFQLP